MTEKIEPIKPKLKELIPFVGLREYSDRCLEERIKLYNAFVYQPELEGDYYALGMLIYTWVVGTAALNLASVGIEYIAR